MSEFAMQLLSKCVKPLGFTLLFLLSPLGHATYSAVIVLDNERVESGDPTRGEQADRNYYAVDVSARLAPRRDGDVDARGMEIPFRLYRFLFHPTWNEAALVPASSASAPYMTVDDPLNLEGRPVALPAMPPHGYAALGDSGSGIGLSAKSTTPTNSLFGVGTAISGGLTPEGLQSTARMVNLAYGQTHRLFTLRLRVENFDQAPELQFAEAIINGDSVLSRAQNFGNTNVDRENPAEHGSADGLYRPSALQTLAPQASLAAAPVDVTEGNVAQVTVTLSAMNRVSDTEVLFDLVGISDGFSTADVVFSDSNFSRETDSDAAQERHRSTNTIAIARGEVTTTIEIRIRDDALNEGAEGFYVQFKPEFAYAAAQTRTRVTIAESDPITVSVADPTAGGEGTSASFAITLTGGEATSEMVIPWSVTTSAGTGQASNDDFEAMTGELRISAGDTMGQIYVPIGDDSAVESAEAYTLTLSQPTGGGTGDITLSRSQVAAQIPASDPLTLSVAVEPQAASMAEDVGMVSFRIQYGDGTVMPPEAVTVEYALAGSATGAGDDSGDYRYPAGYDAGLSSGTATIGTAASHIDVTLPITDDMRDEDDESIMITLRAVVMGGGVSVLPENTSASVTIADDDKLSVAVAPSAEFVREGDSGDMTMVTFTVSLLNAGEASMRTLAQDVRVAYTLAGDATGGSGMDYTEPSGYNSGASSGVVVLRMGTTSNDVSITVQGDTDSEGDETIAFRLTEILAGGDLAELLEAGTTRVNVVINDDDLAREFYITSSPTRMAAVSAAEGAQQMYAIGYAGTNLAGADTFTVQWEIMGTGMRPASAADLSQTMGSLTFGSSHAAGVEQLVTLQIASDTLNEGDEEFTITISGGDQTSGIRLSSATVVTTITDDPADDLQISITRADSGDLVEGAAAPADRQAEFVVSVGNATATAPLTITYMVSSDEAVMGDYTTVAPDPAGTVTIAVGDDEAPITLEAVADMLNESAETLRVELSAVEGALGAFMISASASSASVTIAENDPITVSLARLAGDTGGGEGTSAAFVVTLSGGQATTETVIGWDIAGTGANPIATTDVAMTSGELRVPVGETTGRINVRIADDDLGEVDESYTLTLRTPQGGGTGQVTLGIASVSAQIPTNDPQTLEVELDSAASVTEDEASAVAFKVVWADGDQNAPTVIGFRYRLSGTAEGGGVDYNYPDGYDAVSNSGLRMIAVTTHTAIVSMTVVSDRLDEEDETIVLELVEVVTGASIVDLSATTRASVTIEDDDKLSLSVATAQTVVDEEDEDTLTFTVSLLNAGEASMRTLDQDVRVAYTLGGTAGGGTDAMDITGVTDYTIPSGYNAGASSGVVVLSAGADGAASITVVDDGATEGRETVTFELTEVVAGGDLAEIRAADTTRVSVIINDGESVVREFYITSTVVSVAEGAQIAYMIGYDRMDVGTTPVTVEWTVMGSGARPAAADDFEQPTGSVSFSGSVRTQTFMLRAADDTLNEGDEEFTISISTEDGRSDIYTTADSVITTITDDPDDALQISIVRSDSGDLDENAAGAAERSAVFDIIVGNATATAPLVIGYSVTSAEADTDDYTTVPSGRQITIQPGMTRDILLQAQPDDINEGDETVRVELESVTGALGAATISASASSASATIAENDAIMVSVERLAGDTGAEGTSAVFVVTLSGGQATTPTTVDWEVTLAGGVGGGAGQAANTDFEALAGTVIVPFTSPPVREGRIYVPIVDDDDLEPAESYTLTLRQLTGGGDGQVTLNPAASSVEAQIPASDRPVLMATAMPAMVGEDAGTVTFRVQYGDGSTIPSEMVVARYTFSGTAMGAADNSGDYRYPAGYDVGTSSGTVTIGTGATFADVSVPITDDMRDEAAETIVFELSEVVEGDAVAAVMQPQSMATVTITDDDKLSVVVSVLPALVDEQDRDTVTFSVSLWPNDAPERTSEVRVAYKLAGTAQAATASPDYFPPPAPGYSGAANSGTVTFSPGDSSVDVSIRVQDDDLSEANETVTLELTEVVAGGALAELRIMATTRTSVIINDNDQLTAQIQVIGDASTTEQDTTLVFEVSLTPATTLFAEDVVIAYTVGGDVDGSDYTDPGAGSVTVMTGETTARIMIMLIADNRFEPDEELTVTLQSATGANVGLSAAMRLASITIRNDDPESVGTVVSAGVYLGGAYISNGNMSLFLNSGLPRMQPYNLIPWNHAATTTVPRIDGVANAMPSNVTDWMLLELRVVDQGVALAAADQSSVPAGGVKAGLILSDGSIVGVVEDATTTTDVLERQGVRFDVEIEANKDVYLLLQHRNHLPVLSARPLSTDCSDSGANYCIDYREVNAAADLYYGLCGMKRHSDGRLLMIGGNVDHDAVVGLTDYLTLLAGLGRSSVNEDAYVGRTISGIRLYWADMDLNFDTEVALTDGLNVVLANLNEDVPSLCESSGQ